MLGCFGFGQRHSHWTSSSTYLYFSSLSPERLIPQLTALDAAAASAFWAFALAPTRYTQLMVLSVGIQQCAWSATRSAALQMLLLLLLLICYTLTPAVHCKNRYGRSASALRFLAAVLRHSETAVVQGTRLFPAVHWHSKSARSLIVMAAIIGSGVIESIELDHCYGNRSLPAAMCGRRKLWLVSVVFRLPTDGHYLTE